MEDYPALRRYSGDDASRYDSSRFKKLRGRAVDELEWLLLRRALSRLSGGGKGVQTVLDVPIGTGRMARRLTERGLRVTGVDASADMLDMARTKAAAHEYAIGRVERLPFDDGRFDVVVCVRLFGHLTTGAKSDALKEFRRLGCEGAIVFFPGVTPLLERRRQWQASRGRPLGFWNPLSSSEMGSLAHDAGLRVACVLRLLGPVAETRAAVLRPA
ncbi:MAG TPA: class I SAM-dependent methyltransferase [Thermoleophilia bacterium]|nr:class I SAM-dependent methyltransferase [Thermoleophilia bacterium]